MRREEEIRRLIDESGTYIGEEMMSLTTTTMKPQPRRRKVKKPKLLAINTTLCKYDIVRECAKLMGYKDVDENEPWSMFWIDTGVSIERILEMDVSFS